MQRLIKTFFCAAMLVMGWQQAWGFALIGPAPFTAAANLSQPLPTGFGDVWQVNTIGYGQVYINAGTPGGPVFLGDLGGPKNIGEGYRRNDPVVYYAYDQNYAQFFGTQGEGAADQAFAIMNNFFTNHPNGVDGYSTNLAEFPFNSQHFNLTAQSLYLTDLKSLTLHLLVEQMGLASPERYTWTLEDRYLPPGGVCPINEEYVVVQRNYGILDQPLTGPQTGTVYSPYVNNILYTYGIAENCGRLAPGAVITWSATTLPFAVQPGVSQYTAVAANTTDGLEQLGPGGGGLEIGGFYTGLTMDDAAGLRYLMTSNNIVYETPAAGAMLEDTNFSTVNLLVTSNLASLLEFASTNPQAAVQAQFPNVEIDSVSNYFATVPVPNIVTYFTNYPGSPDGTPPTLVVKTNGFTLTFPERFVYTFGNLVILHEYTNTPAQMQTISIGEPIGAPVGSPPVTNVSYTTTILSNVISGDYYTIPPGTCGYDIFFTNALNNFAGLSTNVFAASTNTTTGAISTKSIVTAFTNNVFEYFTCTFETNGPAKYEGIQHVQFVRVSDNNVDPLTDAFYQPITNSYPMVWFNPTNPPNDPQIGRRQFERIVTAPDFLLTALPNANGPAGNPGIITVSRNIHFETGQILPNLAGPGVIDGETVFSYNNIGTVWWNGPFPNTNSYLPGNFSEVGQFSPTATPALLWASFDGSTNAPIVYPNFLSIRDLESQMIIAISTSNPGGTNGLPDGTNGVPYVPTSLTATGGTPPYSWSVSGLPSGLALLGGNVIEGTPNGNTNGVYDVTVQLMDSSLPTNIVTMPMTINMHESP